MKGSNLVLPPSPPRYLRASLTRKHHKLPGAVLSRRLVAQVFNLLYRRISFGRPSATGEARRLKICATAGWKPALPAFGTRWRSGICDYSGLTATQKTARSAGGREWTARRSAIRLPALGRERLALAPGRLALVLERLPLAPERSALAPERLAQGRRPWERRPWGR